MKKCTECGEKNLNSNDVCDGCGAPILEGSEVIKSEELTNEMEILNQLKKIETDISRIEKNTRRRDGVTISKIDMSFGEMVVLIIKISVASIPAVIIFYIALFMLMGVLGSFFSSF